MTAPGKNFIDMSLALSKNITDFLQQLDTVFARIAADLPAQLTAVESAMVHVGTDRGPFAAAHIQVTLEDLETHKEEVKTNIRSGFAYFSSELKITRRVFNNIQKHILEIESRCDDLNLFSLNTRLATKHSKGVSASTFRAITLELSDRSKTIAGIAANLNIKMAQAMGGYSKVKDNHVSLNNSLEQLEQEQRAIADAGHEHWQIINNELTTISTHSKELIAGLRPQVQLIMLKIQEQDILRQSLHHILKVLEHSQKMAHTDSQENALFIQQAYALVQTLLAESRSHLNEFIENTQNGLRELSMLSSHIGQLEKIEAQGDDLQRYLLSPIDLLMQQVTLMDALIEDLSKTDARWQGMRLQLDDTVATGLEMKSIAKDLLPLEVAMRINGSNDPVMATETNALARNFRTIHSTILSALKNIEKLNRRIQNREIKTNIHLPIAEKQALLLVEISDLHQNAIQTLERFLSQLSDSMRTGQALTAFSEQMQNNLNSLMDFYPTTEVIRSVTQIANDFSNELMNESLSSDASAVPVHDNPGSVFHVESGGVD